MNLCVITYGRDKIQDLSDITIKGIDIDDIDTSRVDMKQLEMNGYAFINKTSSIDKTKIIVNIDRNDSIVYDTNLLKFITQFKRDNLINKIICTQ